MPSTSGSILSIPLISCPACLPSLGSLLSKPRIQRSSRVLFFPAWCLHQCRSRLRLLQRRLPLLLHRRLRRRPRLMFADHLPNHPTSLPSSPSSPSTTTIATNGLRPMPPPFNFQPRLCPSSPLRGVIRDVAFRQLVAYIYYDESFEDAG